MRFLNRRRQAHPPVELNVIPLIDVVFFLLIFYVISTTFSLQETAVPIDRPSNSQATPADGNALQIAILKSGALQIGAQVLDLDGLDAAARAAMETHGSRKVLLVADREVPTGLLLQVMEICSAAGAESVDVAATREGG